MRSTRTQPSPGRSPWSTRAPTRRRAGDSSGSRSTSTTSLLLTYGDGVADIDLAALIAFHRAHGKLATITAVQPPGRFELRARRVSRDDESARSRRSRRRRRAGINGGFFVLEPRSSIASPATTPVREQSRSRAWPDGELAAYRHDGFWQPMDTLRDERSLEELWAWDATLEDLVMSAEGSPAERCSSPGIPASRARGSRWLTPLGAEVTGYALAPPTSRTCSTRSTGGQLRHRRGRCSRSRSASPRSSRRSHR